MKPQKSLLSFCVKIGLRLCQYLVKTGLWNNTERENCCLIYSLFIFNVLYCLQRRPSPKSTVSVILKIPLVTIITYCYFSLFLNFHRVKWIILDDVVPDPSMVHPVQIAWYDDIYESFCQQQLSGTCTAKAITYRPNSNVKVWVNKD